MSTRKKQESTIKQIADDIDIVEMNKEVPKTLNKIDKDSKEDFENFKQLYKGLIDEKYSETYTNEDKDLWEDLAKEMFLKSKYYVLKGDEVKPEKKEESKSMKESVKCSKCGAEDITGEYYIQNNKKHIIPICRDCAKKYSLPELEKIQESFNNIEDLAGDFCQFLRNYELDDYTDNVEDWNETLKSTARDLSTKTGREYIVMYLNSLLEGADEDMEEVINSLIVRVENINSTDIESENIEMDESRKLVKESLVDKIKDIGEAVEVAKKQALEDKQTKYIHEDMTDGSYKVSTNKQEPDEIDTGYVKQYLSMRESKLTEEPSEEDKFKYSLLDRLRMDCDYFLGNGNGYEGHLWAHNVEDQIAKMKELWNSFAEDQKPEWLTMEDIEDYEKRMREVKARKTQNKKVTESEDTELNIKGLPSSAENIAHTFTYYKAYEANFKPLIIVKSGKEYLIYKQDAKNYDEYIESSNSKDYIEGWLHGAVKVKNKVVESVITEAKDKVANTLSKFIYDLTNDKDTEKYGESAWSANEPTKNGKGITIYEVYKNGRSTFTLDDIKEAVLNKYKELAVYGEGRNSVWFYKAPKQEENFTKRDAKKK